MTNDREWIKEIKKELISFSSQFFFCPSKTLNDNHGLVSLISLADERKDKD